ncbi:MAG: ABC transporter permease subunit [Candidatus Harrisonbacteria bacterium]|nr:ABC transporter permease subunit [Candidatus Harrisonbacteria bacterium]MBI2604156.1 ABC transporter permease subunit [Candidatus Harrisonbacteria bacterium]
MDKTKKDAAGLFMKALSWSWIIWFAVPYLFLFVTFFTRLNTASAILGDGRFWAAFFISFVSAVAVVILTALFSVPVAYVLTYHAKRYAHIIEPLLIDIPQTFPPVAVGVIYLFMLGPQSSINIAFTFAAVIIAKLLVSAPFTIGYTLRKFREIRDSKLDLVARSLGANTGNVVSRILIPLARRDITAGLTLSWARAMGEFGGSLIFAGVIAYKTEILPTYTNRVVATDPYLALAATTVLTVFAIVTIVAVRSLAQRKSDS